MCIFNDIFMFVFIVSSILVTVHFVYSLFFKSGKVNCTITVTGTTIR
ncbi:Uncharacterised protein [Shigella sonnei]|nr:Uncharacterised protein [Shigella sonnei]